MLKTLDVYFNKLSKKIKHSLKRLKHYLKRLLLPIYLFPVKLVTYSTYYLVKFFFKFVFSLLRILIDSVIFPFRSLKNLLKSIFILALVFYIAASLFVITDYLRTQYGWWTNIFCSVGVNNKLHNSTVRIVGGYSEGSGFFINDNQVITNFHVIADEPSPKIIFPDGSFITPERIVGDQDMDLAVLFTKQTYPDLVLPLPQSLKFSENEPVIASGYPLGTDLTGKATILKGRFIDFRRPKELPVSFIQTDISLVKGMSGGPLVDQCGNVVGINTLSLSGMSFFVNGDWAFAQVPNFTDQEITKIEVHPEESPTEAVKAFYTYLKARRMPDGFNLLSKTYLEKTNLSEWTNRFTDILDVDIILVRQYQNTKDIVFVKFSTKNWVYGEVENRYYEGTWQTVEEDGVYKMNRSKIEEVGDPDWQWFYE